MHLYRIYPLNVDGRISARWDALCESDHEALNFASWILATDLQAEVWRENSMVGAVSGRRQWGL